MRQFPRPSSGAPRSNVCGRTSCGRAAERQATGSSSDQRPRVCGRRPRSTRGPTTSTRCYRLPSQSQSAFSRAPRPNVSFSEIGEWRRPLSPGFSAIIPLGATPLGEGCISLSALALSSSARDPRRRSILSISTVSQLFSLQHPYRLSSSKASAARTVILARRLWSLN